MRNFRTDDSSELPLSIGFGDLPPAIEGVWEEGVRPKVLPDTESLVLWPLVECCWAAEMDAWEVAVVAVDTSVELPRLPDAASSTEDTSSSAPPPPPPPPPFRRNKDKADDFVRRCELDTLGGRQRIFHSIVAGMICAAVRRRAMP